jgi:hypothetical protein
MNRASVNEIDRIGCLGKLLALTQLYLESNLSITDAILAAESDLVTWNIVTPASGTKCLTSRPKDRNIYTPSASEFRYG